VRIAIFGGTFDPIHSAHLVVAREAAQQFNLDEVIVIPAADPPHKPRLERTPFQHRYRMVELACAGDPKLRPSRLEEGREPSYSIDTIERLKRERPGDELFFLIGADAFAEIRSWHRWQDVVDAVEFIVVTRPGHSYEIPSGARVSRLDSVDLPVSSSAIRAKLGEGGKASELPASILSYVREHRLYGASNGPAHADR
jgi:nicotinate-nucleotide adenylyltransferase